MSTTRATLGPFKDGWTEQDVELVIARDLPDELLYIPIVMTLDSPDCARSGRIYLALAAHSHYNVRGNAILGNRLLSAFAAPDPRLRRRKAESSRGTRSSLTASAFGNVYRAHVSRASSAT